MPGGSSVVGGLSVLAALLALLVPTLAQDLAFIQPRLGQTGDDLRTFASGDDLQIQWTSPFAATSLFIWQEIEAGVWAGETLGVAFAQTEKSMTWTADPLSGAHDGAYQLELRNAAGGNCEGCRVTSRRFRVLPSAKDAKESSLSDEWEHESALEAEHSNAGMGRGVGLGLGLAGVILLGFSLLFVCARRRKHRVAEIEDPPRPEKMDEEKIGNEDTMSSRRPSLDHRSSLDRRSSLSSLSSIISRPSTVAKSFKSVSSAKSWFPPFEFEQPDTHAQDALSQLRVSTQYFRRSIRSFIGKGEVPGLPAPVASSSRRGPHLT